MMISRDYREKIAYRAMLKKLRNTTIPNDRAHDTKAVTRKTKNIE